MIHHLSFLHVHLRHTKTHDALSNVDCHTFEQPLRPAPISFCFFPFSPQHPQFFPDLLEISNILNTGLDRETLAILVNLCESGVHPEALAAVVKELRREAAAVALEEEQEEPEVSETTTA
jgi:mitotic-spindle organizing protein 1